MLTNADRIRDLKQEIDENLIEVRTYIELRGYINGRIDDLVKRRNAAVKELNDFMAEEYDLK